MTAHLYAVGQNDVAANLAVMGDMDIGHDPVVGGHTRDADILCRARIDGDVLAHHVTVANLETRRFARVLFVLGHATDRTKTIKAVVLTNGRVPINDTVRTNFSMRANFDVGTNNRKRTHRDGRMQLRTGIHQCRGMNQRGHLFFHRPDRTHDFGRRDFLPIYHPTHRVFAH